MKRHGRHSKETAAGTHSRRQRRGLTAQAAPTAARRALVAPCRIGSWACPGTRWRPRCTCCAQGGQAGSERWEGRRTWQATGAAPKSPATAAAAAARAPGGKQPDSDGRSDDEGDGGRRQLAQDLKLLTLPRVCTGVCGGGSSGGAVGGCAAQHSAALDVRGRDATQDSSQGTRHSNQHRGRHAPCSGTAAGAGTTGRSGDSGSASPGCCAALRCCCLAAAATCRCWGLPRAARTPRCCVGGAAHWHRAAACMAASAVARVGGDFNVCGNARQREQLPFWVSAS